MSNIKSLALTLCVALAATPAMAAKVGEPAPPFTVTTFDGEQVTLESLRGKVVVLNYWATWCGPCRVELPEMDTYVRRHRASDLVIYAITIDNTAPKSKLMPLASVLSFPLISRLKGRGYGTIRGAVPTNYVIDKAGTIRLAKAGAFNAVSLEAVITPLLAEPAPKTMAAAAP